MNVAELIKELSTLPQDASVHVAVGLIMHKAAVVMSLADGKIICICDNFPKEDK